MMRFGMVQKGRVLENKKGREEDETKSFRKQ